MPAPGQHVFSEKVALVTGATRPIGRAVSMQLALYGCFVIAAHSGGDQADLDGVEELRSLGTLAHSFDVDLSTSRGSSELVDKIEALYGRLDILVNCLEFPEADSFDSATDDQLNSVFDAIVRPAVFGTREALRLFNDRPKPCIVNVLTSRSDTGIGAGFLESAANAAVESLTRSLASFLPPNYRVNAVSVKDRGEFREDNGGLDPELFRPRTGVAPDDVARTVVFLLSSESKGINGQVLEIG